MPLKIISPSDKIKHTFSMKISFSKKSFPRSKTPSQYVSFLVKKMGIHRKHLSTVYKNGGYSGPTQTWYEDRNRYHFDLVKLSISQRCNIIWLLEEWESDKKDWGLLRKIEWDYE